MGVGRWVPVDLVQATGAQVRLRCGGADFTRLERAEEKACPLGYRGGSLYGAGLVHGWPYYSLAIGPTASVAPGLCLGNPVQTVLYDRVPLGEVEVRRGDHVHATNGSIGSVQGLVIDPHDHVTHVLIQEGHLWARKQVAIPIAVVVAVTDGIDVQLTKDEVRDLPARRA